MICVICGCEFSDNDGLDTPNGPMHYYSRGKDGLTGCVEALQARAEAAENALAKRKSGVYITEQQMKAAVYDAYVKLFERWNEDSGGYRWAKWLKQEQGESHLATVLENAIDDLFPGVLDTVMAQAYTWDKEEVER